MAKEVKWKDGIWLLDSGTFPFPIVLAKGRTKEQMWKFLVKHVGIDAKKLKTDPSWLEEDIGKESQKWRGRTFDFANGAILVWLYPGAGIETLVHELTHAVLIVLDRVGIQASSEVSESEIMAYQMEYTMRQAFKRLYP